MKLRDVLPYLYAERFTVEALRSTIHETDFSMDERDELSKLYGESPIVRIKSGFDPYHIIILIY